MSELACETYRESGFAFGVCLRTCLWPGSRVEMSFKHQASYAFPLINARYALPRTAICMGLNLHEVLNGFTRLAVGAMCWEIHFMLVTERTLFAARELLLQPMALWRACGACSCYICLHFI